MGSPSGSGTIPLRQVLTDVTRVGFFQGGGAPEDLPLPAILRAISEYLQCDMGIPFRDDDAGWGRWERCAFFSAVTGEAFQFVWDFIDQPEMPGVCYYGARYLDVFRHGLSAIGVTAHPLLGPEYAERFPGNGPAVDAAAMREAIVRSIAERRMPVIAMGLFGPPEPALICGYDVFGDILIGWDHFQNSTHDHHGMDVACEPNGMFRAGGAYPHLKGIWVIDTVNATPDLTPHHMAALRRAADTLALRKGPTGKLLGVASLRDYQRAISLIGDGDTTAARALESVGFIRFDLAERRAQGDTWMAQAAAALPQCAQHLLAASACLGRQHDLMYEVAEVIKRGRDVFDTDPEALADPARRERVTELLDTTVTAEQCALAHLRRALAVLDEQPVPAAPTDAPLQLHVRLCGCQPGPNVPAALQGAAQLPEAMTAALQFMGRDTGVAEIANGEQAALDALLMMGISGDVWSWSDVMAHADAGSAMQVVSAASWATGIQGVLWVGPDRLQSGLSDTMCWGWDDNLRRIVERCLRDRGCPVLLGCRSSEAPWRLAAGYQACVGLCGWVTRRGAGVLCGDQPWPFMDMFQEGESWWAFCPDALVPRPSRDAVLRRVLSTAREQRAVQRVTWPDGTTGSATGCDVWLELEQANAQYQDWLRHTLLPQLVSRRRAASALVAMAAQAFERPDWLSLRDRLSDLCACLLSASESGGAKHWSDAARLDSGIDEAWATMIPR